MEPYFSPRSNKKLKHDTDTEILPEEMEVQSPAGSPSGSTPIVSVPKVSGDWAKKLFPEETPAQDIYPQYYMGDDDEERYEGVDELFRYEEGAEDDLPKFGP